MGRVEIGVRLGLMTAGLTVLVACVGAAVCPAPQIITVCIPVKAWTQGEENLALIEYAGLAPKSQLRGFIQDYGAMRAAARACAHG